MKDLKIRFTHIQRPILGAALGVALLLMLGPSTIRAQDADQRAFSLKQARDFAIQYNYDAKRSSMDVTNPPPPALMTRPRESTLTLNDEL